MIKWSAIVKILVLIVIVASVSAHSIMAYLSDGDETSNLLTIGGNHISIDEEYDPEPVVPGEKITKKVRIQNDGPNTCYVRVRAVFSDSDVGQYATIDWNTTDWVYNKQDEFYYYVWPVMEGEKTSYLMTSITFEDIIPGYNVKDVELIVYAESYQADGFSNYTEAWDDYQMNAR